MGIQTTPGAATRRAHIIDIGSVGITGRPAASGYRSGYIYPGSEFAFDSEVGAIDAPSSLPAGSTRPTAAITPCLRGISSAWYRR